MDLRSLDWDRLKIFQAVAEEGSLSAAAAVLAVSPAKISRDMEELELSLGQDLFIRSTRGMQLTPLGADVLRSVRNMADSARAITARVTEVDQNQTVVIATRDAIGTYWLARRMPDLLRDYPGIEVTLKIMDDTPDLLAGDADIAIQFEAPTAPNIIARQICWLHYAAYASPDYLAKHGVPETMFDMGKHRLIDHAGYSKQREAWTNKTRAWTEILSRAFQTNSSTVLLEACAAGAGIAAFPTYVSDFDQRVVPLAHIPPLASIRLWLAYSERVRGVRAFEGVLEWLRNAFDPAQYPAFREMYAPPARPIGGSSSIEARPQKALILGK